MSFAIREYIWAVDGMTPTEKLVLLYLTDHGDDNGRGRIKVGEVALSCSISLSCLSNVMAVLEAKDLLSITRQPATVTTNADEPHEAEKCRREVCEMGLLPEQDTGFSNGIDDATAAVLTELGKELGL